MLFPFRWSPLTSHSSKITFSVKLKHSQGCFHRANPFVGRKNLPGQAKPWSSAMVWALDLPCFLDFNQPEISTINPPTPQPCQQLEGFDGRTFLPLKRGLFAVGSTHPGCLECFFLGPFWLKVPHISTALDENSGAGDIYSDQFGEQLSVAVRLLCSGAGASHLPSGYSGNLHEVFR